MVVTFMLGMFVTIVDVIRIYYFSQQLLSLDPEAQRCRTGRVSNFPIGPAFSSTFVCVEVNVGIICACIPVMRPLNDRAPGARKGSHRNHKAKAEERTTLLTPRISWLLDRQRSWIQAGGKNVCQSR